MRLLLDTHVFIWWDDQADAISETAQEALENPDHSLYLSLVSVWEMQIKIQIGKLAFNLPLQEKVDSQQEQNGLLMLPITTAHIYALENLADHHRDPFDRLLVAQARQDGLTLVTADPKVQAYDVNTLW